MQPYGTYFMMNYNSVTFLTTAITSCNKLLTHTHNEGTLFVVAYTKFRKFQIQKYVVIIYI